MSDLEPTNADRADWAREALNVFAKRTFGGESYDHMLKREEPGDEHTDSEDALNDLICNLLHLAQQRGLDVDRCLRVAKGNFAEEMAEELWEA